MLTLDHLDRCQVDTNATSRDQWKGFAEHRRCLTAALAREAPAGRSLLCVLGAGNANDLDLTALLSTHREVHLVDIDSEALSGGAERQGVASHPRLRLHGGVDVTAALGVLSDRTPMSELVPADFEAMAAWPASRTAMVLPGGFDRVASTCLLSQILETAAHSLGKGHRQLADAEAALRRGPAADGPPGCSRWRGRARHRRCLVPDAGRAAGPAHRGTRRAVDETGA